MSDCSVCQQEKLPNIDMRQQEGAEWVCVCGALYRLVLMTDGSMTQRLGWTYIGTSQIALQAAAVAPAPPSPPTEIISRSELAGYLSTFPHAPAAAQELILKIRKRFDLAPPPERYTVVLVMNVPTVPVGNTVPGIQDRLGDFLATQTGPAIANMIVSAVKDDS